MPDPQLITIPDEEVPELIAVYENVADTNPRSLDAIFLLKNYLRFLNDPRNPKLINYVISTLDNNWRHDGLFVIRSGDILNVFSAEDNIDRFASVLRILDSMSFNFYGISRHQMDAVNQLDSSILAGYDFLLHNHFICTPENALKFADLVIPDHIELRPLTQDDVTEMYKGPDSPPASEPFMRQVTTLLPSWGAFHKTTGEMLGRAVTYMSETINSLWVRSECRRQGIAKILVQKMAYERALQGKFSHASVSVDNLASERTFRGCGFTVDNQLVYLTKRRTMQGGN